MISHKNINRRGMGTTGIGSESVPLADVIKREAAEVAGLAAAIAHFAAVEAVSPEALVRVRFARQALEAAGTELARRHTGTKADPEALALLRRRVAAVGGGV